MEDNITNLINLFNGVDHLHLFEEYHDTIQPIVNQYLHLKQFAQNCPNFAADPVFRKEYCYFYGMSRYASQEYQDLYFNTMRECFANPAIISLPVLLRDLRNTHTIRPRIEMSFVSKLMNFVDEVHYPIYDKGIREAFGFRVPLEQNAKMDYYPRMYQAIIEAYSRLSNHPSISAFRTTFNCEGLSSFRVLDIIIISIVRYSVQ